MEVHQAAFPSFVTLADDQLQAIAAALDVQDSHYPAVLDALSDANVGLP